MSTVVFHSVVMRGSAHRGVRRMDGHSWKISNPDMRTHILRDTNGIARLLACNFPEAA